MQGRNRLTHEDSEDSHIEYSLGQISSWKENDAVVEIASLCHGRGGIVSYAHCETLFLLSKTSEYAKILSQMDAVYIDGVGAQLGILLATGVWKSRVTADDFIRPLAQRCAERHHAIAFVGGVPGAALRSARHIADLDIDSIRFCADGYEAIHDLDRLIDQLKSRRIKLVVLGLGQPRQEKVALLLRERIPSLTILCVGGLFENLRASSYAPRWMRRCGLEWTRRLYAEPRRLAPRYLIHPGRTLAWITRRWLTVALQRVRT